MATNVLSEYLVSLGYSVDVQELRKLDQFLGKSNKLLADHTSGIVQKMLVWQGGIVGAFNAVGFAALGIADHVAQADQRYRLLGERMYMSTEATRELDVVTKALGATMDQIAWDPELRGRYNILDDMSKQMQASMGGDFEANLKKIRDVRFEFQKLEVELQYLIPVAVSKLFEAFGTGPDTVISKLAAINSWIVQHGPEIDADLSKYVLPVMHDWADVMGNVWKVLEHVGDEFSYLVAALSGDKQLEETSSTFEKVGRTVDDVSHILARFANGVTEAIDIVVHLATALGLVDKAQWDFAHLDFKGGWKDIKGIMGQLGGAWKDVDGVSGAVLGAAGGGMLGGSGAASLLGAASGVEVGAELGIPLGPAGIVAGGAIGGLLTGMGATAIDKHLGIQQGIQGDANPADMILRHVGNQVDWDAASKASGVAADYLKALALTESNGRQDDATGQAVRSQVGALGLMQIMPDTAKQYGMDPYDAQQNLTAGAYKLRDMLNRYHGDMTLALEAYNDGEGNVDKHLRGQHDFKQETLDYPGRFEHNLEEVRGGRDMPKDSRDYVSRAGDNRAAQAPRGDVRQNININVSVPPGATHDQIAQAVMDKVQQQKNMDMLASYAESYGVWGP